MLTLNDVKDGIKIDLKGNNKRNLHKVASFSRSSIVYGTVTKLNAYLFFRETVELIFWCSEYNVLLIFATSFIKDSFA